MPWVCEACTHSDNAFELTKCRMCAAPAPVTRLALRLGGRFFLAHRHGGFRPGLEVHPWTVLRLSDSTSRTVEVLGEHMGRDEVRRALSEAIRTGERPTVAAVPPALAARPPPSPEPSLASLFFSSPPPVAREQEPEARQQEPEAQPEEDEEEEEKLCALCEERFPESALQQTVTLNRVVERRQLNGNPVPKRDPRLRSFAAQFDPVAVCKGCEDALGGPAAKGPPSLEPRKRRPRKRSKARVEKLAQPRPRDASELVPLPQKPFLRRGDGGELLRLQTEAVKKAVKPKRPRRRRDRLLLASASPDPIVEPKRDLLDILADLAENSATQVLKPMAASTVAAAARRLSAPPDPVRQLEPAMYVPTRSAPLPVLDAHAVPPNKRQLGRRSKKRPVLGAPYREPLPC